jgi:hypothetical protein
MIYLGSGSSAYAIECVILSISYTCSLLDVGLNYQKIKKEEYNTFFISNCWHQGEAIITLGFATQFYEFKTNTHTILTRSVNLKATRRG